MTVRRIAVFIFCIGLISLVAFIVYRTWRTLQLKEKQQSGTIQLPAVTLRKLNGDTINTASYKEDSRLLILNYFNPSCDHCQSMVSELFAQKTAIDTVNWLMITSENMATTQRFADSMKLAQLPSVTVLTDTAYAFSKAFGVAQVPSFFMYRSGVLARKHSGECSIKYLLQ